MWCNQLETLGHNAAHKPPLMTFGTKMVVPIIGQTHPETAWCVTQKVTS